MMTSAAPKPVRENIARAKAYLRRDDLPRSMAAMATALRELKGTRLIGQARFETEVNIHEYVTELNRHQAVRRFFEAQGVLSTPFVTYAKGAESELAERLESIRAGFEKDVAAHAAQHAAKVAHRKETLLRSGQEKLDAGDAPRGRSFLKRAADEFGHEAGVLTDIGQRLQRAGLLFEAAEMFENAIAAFPKDGHAHAGVVAAYMGLQEYPKAEMAYTRALKQFGTHPRTLVNMARMYLAWRKRDEAWTHIQRALQLAPGDAEAKALLAEIEGRGSRR